MPPYLMLKGHGTKLPAHCPQPLSCASPVMTLLLTESPIKLSPSRHWHTRVFLSGSLSLVRHQTTLPVLSVTFQPHSWALRVTQRDMYISVQISGIPETGSTSLIFLTIEVLPLCCCKHLIWIRTSHIVLYIISI